MADADAVVEPGERNVHLLREALAGIAIGPMPSAGSFLPGSGVSVMTAYGKVPLGLINGNTYREGLRPPFRPGAIIDAMREVIRRPEVTHADLIGIAGPPCFPVGCTVTGNLAALAAGRRTELCLQAQVSISSDGRRVIIENIPPNISIDETARIITSRAHDHQWASEHPRLHPPHSPSPG